jgi:hypothetical protein
MAFRKWMMFFAGLFWACAGPVRADKILMKDGKIYDGRIMGETSRTVLIRLSNPDAKPVFLNLSDVQTVIHDRQSPETLSPEAGRFAQLSLLVSGTHFSSRTLGFGWASGLTFEGGFRVHPALELGAGLDLWPALSGQVAVENTQSQTVRGYQAFYAYSGGFHAKVFPFFKKSLNRFEPYVIGGYHWDRVTPKGSGDYFSGTSWLTGVGVHWRWTPAIAFEARVLYRRSGFDTVKFQSGTGDISGVHQDSVSFGTGVAYRFL